MGKFCVILLAVALAAAGGFALVAAAEDQPAAVDYRRDVWPIVEAKCLRCHNPKKKDGKLDMSTRAALLKGGTSGPALVPGNVEKSLMIELVEFDEMPPREERDKKLRVTKQELKKLSDWVAAGALVPDEE